MVEPGTVRKLLETIEQRLLRLQQLSETSVEEYSDDADMQDIAERNFEIMIQACVDLGLHILADSPAPLPETNREVFPFLEKEGFLDKALASRLERMAGFRNLLAHSYADLDPARVHANLRDLPDVRKLVEQLTHHLREAGGLTASDEAAQPPGDAGMDP